MAILYGKDASVKIGSNEVIQCRQWRMPGTTTVQDVTCLGDEFTKEIPMIAKWTATIEAIFDPGDTNGQAALHSAWINKSKITDLKLYIDGTKYYAPDTGAEATAGAYISGVNATQVQSGIATVEFTVSGYGPIKLN